MSTKAAVASSKWSTNLFSFPSQTEDYQTRKCVKVCVNEASTAQRRTQPSLSKRHVLNCEINVRALCVVFFLFCFPSANANVTALAESCRELPGKSPKVTHKPVTNTWLALCAVLPERQISYLCLPELNVTLLSKNVTHTPVTHSNYCSQLSHEAPFPYLHLLLHPPSPESSSMLLRSREVTYKTDNNVTDTYSSQLSYKAVSSLMLFCRVVSLYLLPNLPREPSTMLHVEKQRATYKIVTHVTYRLQLLYKAPSTLTLSSSRVLVTNCILVKLRQRKVPESNQPTPATHSNVTKATNHGLEGPGTGQPRDTATKRNNLSDPYVPTALKIKTLSTDTYINVSVYRAVKCHAVTMSRYYFVTEPAKPRNNAVYMNSLHETTLLKFKAPAPSRLTVAGDNPHRNTNKTTDEKLPIRSLSYMTESKNSPRRLTSSGEPTFIRTELGTIGKDHRHLFTIIRSLLLQSGDVERNPGPELAPNPQSRKPETKLTIVSQNCRGLGETKKLKHLLNNCHKIGKKSESYIVGLQETMIADEDKIKFS